MNNTGLITYKQDLALVLRTQVYSENDIILTILSQNNGKISAIIKKNRGKSVYSPEIMDLACFEFKAGKGNSNLYSLRSVKPQKSFIKLRDNLNSFCCACAWIETIDYLSLDAHLEASELFDISIETLDKINDSKEIRQTLKILYESIENALQILGYASHEKELASLNNLKALAHKIENLSHKKLRSFENVYAIATKSLT